MIRKIIHINEELCNGCGACANACHEGAIAMVNGKAKLIRDDYCDGMGDCLPECPTGAITFEEREAAAYDKDAVEKNKQKQQKKSGRNQQVQRGCPGSMMRTMHPDENRKETINNKEKQISQLRNWPVQIKLAPVNAPYFDGAKLLVAADCSAYAYAAFHQDFICGSITLIGCPKLDQEDYSEKLTEIISQNNIQSIAVVRMEVPCCGGLELAVKKAVKNSGKYIPCKVTVISVDGKVCTDREI